MSVPELLRIAMVIMWIAALGSQVGRMAFKYRPDKDDAYRRLTIATCLCALVATGLAVALAVATGSAALVLQAGIGVIIFLFLLLAA